MTRTKLNRMVAFGLPLLILGVGVCYAQHRNGDASKQGPTRASAGKIQAGANRHASVIPTSSSNTALVAPEGTGHVVPCGWETLARRKPSSPVRVASRTAVDQSIVEPQGYGPALMPGVVDSWSSEPSTSCELDTIDLGGPARTPAAGRYRIRSGDTLQFTYQQTRERMHEAYRISYGDQVRINSDTHPELNLSEPTEVLPDGTISIPGVQSVQVYGLTFEEAKRVIEAKLERVGKYNAPRITILPVVVYQRLNDLLNAVDSRFGDGGQGIQLEIIRDGSVALPKIGSVNAVGLTKEELMYEINSRYDRVVKGIHVTVNIVETAPAFVYVLGQVREPGRIEARLPLTLLQAVAQAGGQLQGGKMKYVVVVRRTPDWRLVARRIDLKYLNKAHPGHIEDLWLWDSDVVIVPKDNIQRLDELINMYLTRGAYALIPNQLAIDQNTIF